MSGPDAPVFPPGRYGRRREPRRIRRWVPAIVLVLVAVAALLITERLYRQYSDPYEPRVTGLEQVSDGSATVVFTVRMPDRRRATCRVQALDASGAEVGYVEVPVDHAGTIRTTVTTSAQAHTADVLGCRPS